MEPVRILVVSARKILFIQLVGNEVVLVGRSFNHRELILDYDKDLRSKLESGILLTEITAAGVCDSNGKVLNWSALGFEFITPEENRATVQECLLAGAKDFR